MDNKCYLWILKNLDKYSFAEEAGDIKKIIDGVVFNEETITSDMILKKAENFYNRLVSEFYNNIIGYQNGLADSKITSDTLDCYFIETSEGVVPIGYYKIARPVESVVLIEDYLKKCVEDIERGKNKTIANWQKRINRITSGYKDIKNSLTKNTIRAIIGGVAMIAAVILSVVTLVKINIFTFIFNMNDPEVVQKSVSAIPILEGGGKYSVIALTVPILIIISLAVILGTLCVKEVIKLRGRNTTEEVSKSISNYAVNLEKGILNRVSVDSKPIHEAARQGRNLKVSLNPNAGFISTINEKISIAEKFVEKNQKEKTGMNVIMIIFIIISALFFTFAYSDILPDYMESVSTEEDSDSDEVQDIEVNNESKSKTASKKDTTEKDNKTTDNKTDEDKTPEEKEDNGTTSSVEPDNTPITPEKPEIPDTSTNTDNANNVNGVNNTDKNMPQATKTSTYIVRKSDAAWTEANTYAAQAGGHLVYINSREEFNKVCKKADAQNLKVFWVGATRKSGSWSDARWQNGEKITYINWYSTEPSYIDENGNAENYLMVFKVGGSWYFNDAINNVAEYYSGKMGYIVEVEG